MQVWRDLRAGDAECICFDAAEQGMPVLGQIVENNQLRYALWQAAADAGVCLIEKAIPNSLSLGSRHAIVELADGSSHRASLIVGADGSASWVREAAGMKFRRSPYHQQGLVMHVRTERDHAQTAWQRFLPDGPLALLPLSDGRCSVVWSCPDARAEQLMSLDAVRLGAELTQASQQVLGEIEVTTQVRGFPLVAGHARNYARERCVLLGDAAHQVHPLAGQGVNLGFRDARVLADELRAQLAVRGADPGDRRGLLRYQRRRKGDNLATIATMDLINRAFSNGDGPVAGVAARGLGLVDRVGPLKRALASHALGDAGSPPSG
jgi:ubiquinone biosynthesis UbiH/UbiF/VisC/COQ6 family hydroxylase